MKENEKTLSNLPTMLNADAIACVLGILKGKAYELMRSSEFPTLRIGKHMMVNKQQFENFINKKSGETIE